jgi:hypothetical protein
VLRCEQKFLSGQDTATYVAAEWLRVIDRIWWSWFQISARSRTIPSGKCQNSTLNYSSTASLFIISIRYSFIIRRCRPVVWGAESLIKWDRGTKYKSLR